MVQVDVFWSYAIGAGFAVAASRQLGEAARRGEEPLASGHFSRALLFLATVFAPSGLYLLWAFPSWETMHVGTRDMPAWLACGFAVTNVTQGVLGFFIARWLILGGRSYAAFLNWVGGYLAMFFILVHGWDGTGYQRFFAPTRADFLAWEPAMVGRWLVSDVAIALAVMGVFFLPPMLYWTATWLRDGRAAAGARPGLLAPAGRLALVGWTLATVLVGALACAIGASLLVRALGWAGGALAFAGLGWAVAFRPGGAFGWLYARLLREPARARGPGATTGDSTSSSSSAAKPLAAVGV